MQKRRKMVVGNRIVITALFPVLIVMWLTGWLLFCVGLRSREIRETGERSVAVTGVVFEEFEEPRHTVPYSADSSVSL